MGRNVDVIISVCVLLRGGSRCLVMESMVNNNPLRRVDAASSPLIPSRESYT